MVLRAQLTMHRFVCKYLNFVFNFHVVALIMGTCRMTFLSQRCCWSMDCICLAIVGMVPASMCEDDVTNSQRAILWQALPQASIHNSSLAWAGTLPPCFSCAPLPSRVLSLNLCSGLPSLSHRYIIAWSPGSAWTPFILSRTSVLSFVCHVCFLLALTSTMFSYIYIYIYIFAVVIFRSFRALLLRHSHQF